MSISRAWVGSTRSLLESYFDTWAKRAEKKNCWLSKTTTIVRWKAEIVSFSFLLHVVWHLAGFFLPLCVSILYHTWSINLTAHLICFSQLTCQALKKHLFLLNFQAHFCSLQITRDSICVEESVLHDSESDQRMRWNFLHPERRPQTVFQ